ncbi:MAG: SHOCT domain-containing protein [Anaerolineae bacterium]
MMGGGIMEGLGGVMGLLGLFGGLFSLVFSIGLLVLVLLGIWLWQKTSPALRQPFDGAQDRAQGTALSSEATAEPLTGTLSVGRQSAREILQIRYARGELTREEYQTMLQDLDLNSPMIINLPMIREEFWTMSQDLD